MTCPKCGTVNPASTEFCSSCGESLADRSKESARRTSSTAVGVLLGLFTAPLALLGILMLGFSPLFSMFHPLANAAYPLTPSGGSAIFWVLLALANFAFFLWLLISRRARRLAAFQRAFLITISVVLLGGLSLCSVFAVPSIFDQRF